MMREVFGSAPGILKLHLNKNSWASMRAIHRNQKG